jgi:carbon storage regulator
MLVLTRKVGQEIRIGEDITVVVVRIQGDKVRLGIDAPPHVQIHREEVRRRLQAEKGRGEAELSGSTPASAPKSAEPSAQ